MIGLVLVTHGRLADEFKAALEHVMGPQKQIEAVTIGAEDDSIYVSDIIRRSTASTVATALRSSPTCSAARPPTSRSPA
jgi:mannose/fructose-specific phosphotransferase system component IIA